MKTSHQILARASHAAIVAGLLGAPAFAQTAPAATPVAAADDALVVTGYRAAVQSAIESKRELTVIGEAFSAEDIGKLPDTSIAETLGRLPGLATQRLDGRSQVLSLRGLGPDFSNTLLNGREQVSSSDNRGVEYDQYPSELVSSGIVYKTPYAGLIGQGLAGTVDLRTARPLDYKDRVISLAARYEFNEEGSLNPDKSSNGYRATATYIDQFADDTIGVALGVAYQSSPTQIKSFEAWGYPTTPINGADAFIIGGAKPYVKSTELDRLGVFGTLEYKPSENFHSQFDLFYSDYKENQALRGIEFPLFWSGAKLRPGATAENGIVTNGTFDNVYGVVRNDYKRKSTENWALGWRNTYTMNNTTFDLDLSYSRSDRKISDLESYSGVGYGASGTPNSITFDRNSNGSYNFQSLIDYADTSLIQLTDPQGWGGGNNVVQAGFINAPDTTDELKQLRFAVGQKVSWGPISKIEIGFNYADRSKKRVFEQSFLTLTGNGTALDQGAVRIRPIPQDALLDNFTGLHFMGLGDQVTYDPRQLVRDGTYTPVSVALSSLAVPQNWKVQENVYTGWVRADIDTSIGDNALTGNIGGMVVYTDQSSTGSRIEIGTGSSGSAGVNDATFVPVKDGATYTYFLPSLNLTFKFNDQTQLRFGAARTLARARMDQLNASLSPKISVANLPSTDPNTSAFSAEGGNPRLRPYIADGVDLSLEHYFGRRGYVSAALFYKKLRNYVNANSSFLTDFSYLVPSLSPEQQAILGTTQGITKGPTNDGDGDLYGFEVTASLPFELLTPALEGFGVQSSASYTYSSVKYDGNPDPLTVPGLSDWVVNSTAYFEKWGFEARLSHRYRSGFLAEVSGISSSRQLRSAKGESLLDAQIGYRFQSGALEGLSLTFQALNLTDEPFVTYENGDPERVIRYERYGRTYLIGGTYRF